MLHVVSRADHTMQCLVIWWGWIQASLLHNNEGKIAASFCWQVAALVPDMFCNFYLLKNHKIAKSSATTEARGKISTYLESSEFYRFFNVGLTKFENYQILLNKICHIFLVKLFVGWESLITALPTKIYKWLTARMPQIVSIYPTCARSFDMCIIFSCRHIE